MNQRTAKQIRRNTPEDRHGHYSLYRMAKKAWNKLPRTKRHIAREAMTR